VARAGLALLILLALAAASEGNAQTAPPSKVARSVERVFGREAIADSVSLDGELILRVHRANSPLGFAVVRNVIGKDQPITFLVAVDTAGVLKDLDVLVYREPYGGEVAYEAWRKQFRGKTAESPLEVARDIRSISGATISVHAVTEGVRRALADLARWRREGRLR
jgi:Na+-translocating ferredoxin:NAD+ oxidoreductase RnfG subunit